MSDLISRQKAIQKIKELPNSPNGYSATYDKASIIMAIEDVEPVECVHAHWIDTFQAENGYYMGICSHCYLPNIVSLYCGKCGAKMDEEVDDG